MDSVKFPFADVEDDNTDRAGRLDPPPPASVIIEAAKHYHALRKWFMHLILVMPDHLHAIVSFYERRVETPRPTMMAVVDGCRHAFTVNPDGTSTYHRAR